MSTEMKSCEDIYSEDIFYRQVCGDSMVSPPGERVSLPADWVIKVNKSKQATCGSLVVARHKNTNTETVRKLSQQGSRSMLLALNPKYKAIELTPSWEIIGVVESASYDLV